MTHSPPTRLAPAPSIRMVALDLDGTILESGEAIHSDVIDLVRLLSKRGIRCVTATGRPIDFQLELLTRYDLSASSGCFTALMADERELYLLHEGTYTPDQEWNDWIRHRWQTRMNGALQWVHQAHQEATRRGMSARTAPTAQIAARGLATLRFDDPEPAAAICAWLSSRLPTDNGSLACNRNDTIVQVYDAAAGKASVLSRLATLWEIPPAQILAIGNSPNDESMLDGVHGFRCATVANAAATVKTAVHAAGGYIAHAPTGAGVIEAVHALVPEASDR